MPFLTRQLLKQKRIVIVGGGAGGLELATRLGKSLGRTKLAKVYLADGASTHIWKPLLHEVATGTMNVGEDEVNYFTHAHYSGHKYFYGYINAIDRERKVLISEPIKDMEGNVVSGPRELKYDTVILAVGGHTNSFGTPGVEQHCFRLDSPKEAERLRQRFLGHALGVGFGKFPKIRIGIVGAGPTGIELAAEIHHTMREIRTYGFKITKDQLEVTVIEAGPKILPGTLDKLSDYAHNYLTQRGIDIRVKCAIKEVTEKGFILGDGSVLEKDIKIWAAGIKTHEWLSKIGVATDRINRIMNNVNLQSEDPNIYAIGDCANTKDPSDPNKILPPTAQVAHQQAEWLAQKIVNDMNNKPTPPFKYVSQGMLVSLGTTTAVGTLSGFSSKEDYHIRGRSAKFVYSTLYRMHQAAIYGPTRTGFIWLGDKLRSLTLPQVKLH